MGLISRSIGPLSLNLISSYYSLLSSSSIISLKIFWQGSSSSSEQEQRSVHDSPFLNCIVSLDKRWIKKSINFVLTRQLVWIRYRWSLWNWQRITSLALYRCIVTSSFPKLWKIARISPIPKVNEPRCDADHCPVSILPTLSKVFEHLVLHQLTEYINEEALLGPTISGFRKRHSTTSVLLGIRDALIRVSSGG